MIEHAGRREKGFDSTNHLLLMGFLKVPHRAMVRRAFFARKGHARDRPQTECFQVKTSGALQGPCQPHACPVSWGPTPPWGSVGSDLTGLSLRTCSHSQGHHVRTEAFPLALTHRTVTQPRWCPFLLLEGSHQATQEATGPLFFGDALRFSKTVRTQYLLTNEAASRT